MTQSQSQHIFVEVRVYRFDPEKHDTLPAPTGPGVVAIDAQAVEFVNLAQATAVYEDTAKVLLKARDEGRHLLEHRPKPGPPKPNTPKPG